MLRLLRRRSDGAQIARLYIGGIRCGCAALPIYPPSLSLWAHRFWCARRRRRSRVSETDTERTFVVV